MEYESGNIIDVPVLCLYLVLSALVSGVDLLLSNYMYTALFDQNGVVYANFTEIKWIMILDMQNNSHILKVAGINHFSACVTLIIIYIFTLIPE